MTSDHGHMPVPVALDPALTAMPRWSLYDFKLSIFNLKSFSVDT